MSERGPLAPVCASVSAAGYGGARHRSIPETRAMVCGAVCDERVKEERESSYNKGDASMQMLLLNRLLKRLRLPLRRRARPASRLNQPADYRCAPSRVAPSMIEISLIPSRIQIHKFRRITTVLTLLQLLGIRSLNCQHCTLNSCGLALSVEPDELLRIVAYFIDRHLSLFL